MRTSDGHWKTLLRAGPTVHSVVPGDDGFCIPCQTSSGEFHTISRCDFDSEGRIIQADDHTYRIRPAPARIPTGDVVITRDNIDELLNARRIERRTTYTEWETIHPNGSIARFETDTEPDRSFDLAVPYKTESGSTDILYGYHFDTGGEFYQDEDSYYIYRVVAAKPPPPPLSPSMRAIGAGYLECPYCKRCFSVSNPISAWHRLTCAHAAGAAAGDKEPSSVRASLSAMALGWLMSLGLIVVGLVLLIAALPMLLGATLITGILAAGAIASIGTLGWILIVLIGIWFRLGSRP